MVTGEPFHLARLLVNEIFEIIFYPKNLETLLKQIFPCFVSHLSHFYLNASINKLTRKRLKTIIFIWKLNYGIFLILLKKLLKI
jgi:hypothetical protein